MASVGKLYFINLGKGGTFHKSGGVKSSPSDVDSIAKGISEKNIEKVVIHFHGGLVSEAAGMETAYGMEELYTEGDLAHPVSVVWETGLVETIKQNMSSISNTKLFKKLLKYLLKVVSKHLGVDGARGPGKGISYEEIGAELDLDAPFRNQDALVGSAGARGAATGFQNEDSLRDQLYAELEEEIESDPQLKTLLKAEGGNLSPASTPGAKGIFSTAALLKSLAAIAFRVISRFLKSRDHGFYPTVMEELLRELSLDDLGAHVWGAMKSKAESMWKDNAGRHGDDLYGGSYLLDKLLLLQKGNPALKIDLVGHSAGSIAICHLLKVKAVSYPDLKIRNITFLAPACTTELFHDELVSKQDRFEKFRMFTMHDKFETEDQLVKRIYTRSLLYFISGVLEPDEVDMPLAGLELHSRGNFPYQSEKQLAVSSFLREVGGKRLVLSVTDDSAPAGFRSKSEHHGDFDDDLQTRGSLRHLVKG